MTRSTEVKATLYREFRGAIEDALELQVKLKAKLEVLRQQYGELAIQEFDRLQRTRAWRKSTGGLTVVHKPVRTRKPRDKSKPTIVSLLDECVPKTVNSLLRKQKAFTSREVLELVGATVGRRVKISHVSLYLTKKAGELGIKYAKQKVDGKDKPINVYVRARKARAKK